MRKNNISKEQFRNIADLYHTGVCLMYFWLIVVFKAYIFPPIPFFANNAKVGRGEGNSEPKTGGHNFSPRFSHYWDRWTFEITIHKKIYSPLKNTSNQMIFTILVN